MKFGRWTSDRFCSRSEHKRGGTIIIIITRRLQLQATVKRFLSDPDNDLDIDLAKYYGLTSLHNQYLLNYKLKDRALQFLDHNDLINTMYPLALVIKNVALDHSYT